MFPKTRQAILSATLLNPQRWWYLSDLAAHLHVRPSSLQRELRSLVDAGILRSRRDGNRVYYQAESDCPFLSELQSIFIKTVGVADQIRSSLGSLAKKIDWAFIFGSIARGEALPTSDVDLMIVGHIGLAELSKPLQKVERRIGRPINPTVYTIHEVEKKLSQGHHFLKQVFENDKIFILGTSDELAEAVEKWAHKATPDQHRGVE